MHLPQFAARALLACLCLPAPAALAQDMLFFRSPSGNIGCMMAIGDYAGVRCDMSDLTPSYRKRPADCDFDWGSSFGVDAQGKGYLACVSDSVMSQDAFTLGYGEAVTLGAFTCRSEKTGMTCTNGLGHGFSIAKAQQRLF